MQNLVALLSLILAAASVGSLVSGAGYSEWLMPGGLPLGNALAALGLCCSAGAAFLLSPLHSISRRISRGALVVAALWLPLSVALAGNLALNFSGARGDIWLAYSAVAAFLALGSLVLAMAGLLLRLPRSSSSVE